MAESFVDTSREAAFLAFRAEFTRNGFDVPEGLLEMLNNFKLRSGESPEDGRARLYKLLWSRLWFGSKKTLGAQVGGKPTYVYPPSLKRVVREIVPGNLVDRPDPTHSRVYKVNIQNLASATWPAVRGQSGKGKN